MLNEDLKKVIGEARKIKLEVFYEGKDISDYIHKDLLNFSQSDSLNEFDTIELSLENRDRLWMNGWKPLKGERLKLKLIYIIGKMKEL